MSRWIARLVELRGGAPLLAPETNLSRSKCSNVQNCPLGRTFEHLNILNTAERTSNFDATDLCCLYYERAAIFEFDGGEGRAKAEARAWNQVARHWHRQHGSPASDNLCAGCGQPIEGAPEVVLFPRGERAHAGNGSDCIRRWKAAAAVALAAIGIPTPDDIAAEIEVADAPATMAHGVYANRS